MDEIGFTLNPHKNFDNITYQIGNDIRLWYHKLSQIDVFRFDPELNYCPEQNMK